MKTLSRHLVIFISAFFSSPIALLMLSPSAQAKPLTLQPSTPIAFPSSDSNENPTCYIQLPGRSRQTLDSICGTRDPKPNRVRNRHELDRDGLPFVLKENFRKVQEAQRKLQEANAKMEQEMPVSDNILRLREEQKRLSEQYSRARTPQEQNRLYKQLQENNRKIDADPSLKKSYEMMRKLYQDQLRINF